MTNKIKKTYMTPLVDMTTVELEQGIAAGSATVDSPQQEWENDSDNNQVIDW